MRQSSNTWTHSRCLISALKLTSAAWWIEFLVLSSSFSRATVSSDRFTLPSRLKSRAYRQTHTYKSLLQISQLKCRVVQTLSLCVLPVRSLSYCSLPLPSTCKAEFPQERVPIHHPNPKTPADRLYCSKHMRSFDPTHQTWKKEKDGEKRFNTSIQACFAHTLLLCTT